MRRCIKIVRRVWRVNEKRLGCCITSHKADKMKPQLRDGRSGHQVASSKRKNADPYHPKYSYSRQHCSFLSFSNFWRWLNLIFSFPRHIIDSVISQHHEICLKLGFCCLVKWFVATRTNNARKIRNIICFLSSKYIRHWLWLIIFQVIYTPVIKTCIKMCHFFYWQKLFRTDVQKITKEKEILKKLTQLYSLRLMMVWQGYCWTTD